MYVRHLACEEIGSLSRLIIGTNKRRNIFSRKNPLMNKIAINPILFYFACEIIGVEALCIVKGTWVLWVVKVPH